MWAILQRLGYSKVLEELNGSKIHRLENLITLGYDVHMYFDKLLIWFTPTVCVFSIFFSLSSTEGVMQTVSNKYRLETGPAHAYLKRTLPEFVTFTTPDPEVFPVPSPTYLSIHATCAKIANLSKCV